MVKFLEAWQDSYITADFKSDDNFSEVLRHSLVLNSVIVSPFMAFNEIIGYVFLNYPVYPAREIQWMQEFYTSSVALPIMQSIWFNRFRENIDRNTKWKILGQQAGALAHSLKTPIATLDGCFKLLDTQTLQPPVNKSENLQIAKDQLKRIRSTLANLLSYVREIHLEIRPVKVRDLIELSINSSTPKAYTPKRQSRPTVLTGDALNETVFLDSPKIQLVLRNLIDNAYESRVPAKSKQPREVEVRATGDEQELTISVLDNGIGIPNESVRKIFDPFFTTKEEGHGLGLAVAQRYVQEHGGRINARNRESGGACFEVILPWVASITDRRSLDG